MWFLELIYIKADLNSQKKKLEEKNTIIVKIRIKAEK